MKRLERLLRDRRRRQSGSVLSALLIIVIFLSIMIGALLTELTDSFALSRDLVSKVKTEATVTSAVELAINQLQVGTVPPVCARDFTNSPALANGARGPWFLSLNGHPAAATETCTAIVPEASHILAAGSFTVDGILDTAISPNRYLVSDSGGMLSAVDFGQSAPRWSLWMGGPPTAPPVTVNENTNSEDLLAPLASRAGCAGACVAVFNSSGGAPGFDCVMDTSGSVNVQPAVEVTGGGTPNFGSYAFLSDSSGNLSVFDTDSSCQFKSSAALGGSPAGPPLVFSGTQASNGKASTVTDDVFVVVTSGSGTSLQHWAYTETTTKCAGSDPDCNPGPVPTLSRVGSRGLNGVNAVGYGISSTVPSVGTTLTLAVAASGWLDLARITVGSGPTYTMPSVASTLLPNGSVASRAPYWCHSTCGDLIGVGGTNGFLYLYGSGLGLAYTYDGQPDGRPAINTTPMADGNGDWYFGANDGYVYDVEIPVSGSQLFKAAKFGPGAAGAVLSSPIVESCSSGPCLYFGADSSADSWFYRIGSTRLADIRACVSDAAGSTNCASNPRLWARVQVGGGGGAVLVQGWSFYSP